MGNEGDEAAVGCAIGARLQLVQRIADALDHGQVGALGRAADIVGLAGGARLEDGRPRPGVILDEEPVANVGALAVDRYRLAREALDGEWHELLGEMVGAELQWA